MILAQKQSQFNRKLSIDNGGKRAEFAEKTALLRASYPQIPAFDFYNYLYQGDQAPKVYAIDGRTYKTAQPDDLPMIAAFRSDLYIPLAIFSTAFTGPLA